MLDFVQIRTSSSKNGLIIYPEFVVKESDDLMVQGRSFYAIWDETRGFWTKEEFAVARLVDRMLAEEADKHPDQPLEVKWMQNFSTNKWSEWQKYCKSLSDSYHELDVNVVFSNEEVQKQDYVTRVLPYPLQEIETPAYTELSQTLYNPEELEKLEWAVGSIIDGGSKSIQKFLVLYGGPGTGKSTMLNIIQQLFPGYYSTFDSKSLGASSSSFALEAFRDNPLLAIEHDGDLSRIEDNTKINSIVSHEEIVINEKFKSTYARRLHTLLFMGTNKPVRITDAKSGIIRRLIDVHPTGERVERRRYEHLIRQIPFELGGIAQHCLNVYRFLGATYYDAYVPSLMMSATNDMYNFLDDNFLFFSQEAEEGIPLRVAWNKYKEYCEDARVMYPLSMRQFRLELQNYFREFSDRKGNQRSVYSGFLTDKFEVTVFSGYEKKEESNDSWLRFDQVTSSRFDSIFFNCPAQYCKEDGTPKIPWDRVTTTLHDINTKEVHYVKTPLELIVLDFDLKDETGEKSFQKNFEKASQYPPTYAEVSKSGSGIHLHYFYDGDPTKLSQVCEENVEIKVYVGKSALRRKLQMCNDYPIMHLSSGLPLKEVKPMMNVRQFQSERGLRTMILRNLRKEIHSSTKSSMDFIYKILDDAYKQGLSYDVRDMRPEIQAFALGSTHNADYCLTLISKMKFCSEEASDNLINDKNKPLVFFDIEIFPNLFIVCWKKAGSGEPILSMINPKPRELEDLVQNSRLVGFNNRKYDNHMVYAAMMGYSIPQLYDLSQRIISGERDAFFREAYNLSFTDIYDFLSASNKMSLKKWEIKLGIHHQELRFRWDQPVPEPHWQEVADYCKNDVFATEAVWDANQADWTAREILAEWAGMTENDTTNSLTTKIIIGDDRNPQSQFIHPDLSTIFEGYEYNAYGIDPERYDKDAKIVTGKSIYRGRDPGEGGYALGRPGIYFDVAVLDIASMHPSSAIKLKIFGEYYTVRFKDIVDARLYIKHKEYEKAKSVIPERLWKYLDDKKKAKKLANALKTAINSVYGLTSASFPNKLRDPRNKDNVVAKYGALFMITLDDEIRARGYDVLHIKTDSVKIANADSEIIQFVIDFGRKYGFEFEHESSYSKIALMNDAVYVARFSDENACMERYGYIPEKNEGHFGEWTATGTQFQIPYVFKTLFSHEEILFEDMCETKSVTTSMYLDFNENLGEEEHDYRFVGRVGSFCPMKDGVDAALLLRDNGDKFTSVTGTKKPGGKAVYRWMESEMVLKLGLENEIDRTYYRKLVDDAVDSISKYGDFDEFVSDSPFGSNMNLPIAA